MSKADYLINATAKFNEVSERARQWHVAR